MFIHAMNIIKMVNPLRKKRPANECTSPMGEKIRGLTPLSIRRVVITTQRIPRDEHFLPKSIFSIEKHLKNKSISSSGSYPLHFVTATIKNPELQRIFDSFEWGNYSWIEEQSFLHESNIPSNSATFRTVKNRPRYFGLPTPDNHPPGAHTHTRTMWQSATSSRWSS